VTGVRPVSKVPGRGAIGLGAAVLAGGAALLAAFATGTRVGQLNAGVEGLAGTSAMLLSDLAYSLPLGYAFAAGMVAAVNPCGFALLPAYLGLYLGERGPSEKNTGPIGQLRRSLLVSASVTAAFVLLFGTAGVILSVAVGALARHLPWAGLAVGLGLLVIGARQLAGRSLYTRWGEELADRFGAAAGAPRLGGFFAFGLAYALGSLSCTLPIFLAVVGATWTLEGPLAAASSYASYALGMGVVIAALTIAAGLLKSTTLVRMPAVARYVSPASAILVLIAGAYVVYYWLTIGGLLRLMLRSA
jgi:cytochrome c biogenesis protein CcdA